MGLGAGGVGEGWVKGEGWATSHLESSTEEPVPSCFVRRVSSAVRKEM